MVKSHRDADGHSRHLDLVKKNDYVSIKQSSLGRKIKIYLAKKSNQLGRKEVRELRNYCCFYEETCNQ